MPPEEQEVVPFVGALVNQEISPEHISSFLSSCPFEVDRRSEAIPFDHTDYYKEEMGENLRRWWFTLASSWSQTDLAEKKRTFNEFEQSAAEQFSVSERPVNLDPGYVRGNQVVLASTKYVAHRLCIGRNMYAELTLLFEEGEYHAMPWTYPDYRGSVPHEFFRAARDRYLRELEA